MIQYDDYIKDELIRFFLWFRENGEKHIGITIEELIQKYIDGRL